MSYHRSRIVQLPSGRRVSLGDASSAQLAGTVGTLTASGVTAALGAGVFAGSAALVPIVGPILGAAVFGIQTLIAQSGCGPTCVVTSQWANQAAAQLDQLTNAYFSLPSPRTESQKAAALGSFDAIWAKLQQLCGQPGTGNAGVRCITDRQAGACTWRQKYTPTIPGQPAVGQCWNWFNGYRDVIAQDVTTPDPTPTVPSVNTSVFGGSGGGSSSVPSSLLPIAALIGLIVLGVAL